MEELKPCPFCGLSNLDRLILETAVRVGCHNCKIYKVKFSNEANFDFNLSLNELIKWWNTRR